MQIRSASRFANGQAAIFVVICLGVVGCAASGSRFGLFVMGSCCQRSVSAPITRFWGPASK